MSRVLGELSNRSRSCTELLGAVTADASWEWSDVGSGLFVEIYDLRTNKTPSV